MMSKSRLVPWLGFGATLVGVAFLWHGGPSRSPTDKATPADADAALAMASGTNPTRLIVDFKDDVSSETLANNGLTEIPISDYSAKDRLYRVDFANAADAAAAKARLSHDPSVESVDYDSVAGIPPDEQQQEQAQEQEQAAANPASGSMEAECQAGSPDSAFPNDACYKYQWHMRQLGMPDAWKRGNGKGIVVAVIDTGVTKVGDLAETKFVPGYNFIANNDNAADDHGHGTHVAGTIAQSTNNKLGVAGVAYGAAIMPIKVLSARGSGSVAGITQGIRWAADHGANVINMSLGGPTRMGSMASAVKYAHDKGVVIIAAAGNDGRGRVGYPAAYPGVVAVASTQFDESTTFYSNWGKEIDVAAPGGNTRVDQNGDGKPDGVLQHTIVPGNTSQTDYLWFMGTSMASPHAAGVAALIMGAGVKKPDAVEAILLGTARTPKGNSATDGRVDDHYGAGIVDANAALKKAKDGKGAGEFGLAAAMSLLGIALMRRRGVGVEKLGLGFAAALIAGSSGLFFLPELLPQSWTHAHAVGAALSDGVADTLAGAIGPNPLVLSAFAPLALTVLLYGVRKLRPALAGFGFGVAGALLFAAIAGTVDVHYMPNMLDPIWLAAQAAVAGLLATAVLRKA
jgi:serine protease